ncbi:MAG: hypothetical protein EPN91_10845 [Salinibacterium sp.]|nr:MAG: hypothetical protein EPN91_10845 [Salinibacterium sp.]
MTGAEGLVAGLLIGAGVGGHALRLVTPGPVAATCEGLGCALGTRSIRGSSKAADARRFIATSAMVLYSIAAVLVLRGYASGYMVAVLGPLVGLSAVLIARRTDKDVQVDRFQVVLGLFQGIAAVASIAAWCGAWS